MSFCTKTNRLIQPTVHPMATATHTRPHTLIRTHTLEMADQATLTIYRNAMPPPELEGMSMPLS